MTILRTDRVTQLTGLSRTTLWRRERAGEFPMRLRLGANSVGWLEEDVCRWIESRPRGMAGFDAITKSSHGRVAVTEGR
jgi:prophage regulatory protein